MSTLLIQPDTTAGLDTYLNSGLADQNFDGTNPMTVGTKLLTKTLRFNRVILSFNLAGLPAGATVNSATITLKNNGGAGISNSQFTANRLTQSAWVENQATWNSYSTSHAWTAAGGDYTATGHDTTTAASFSSDLVFSGVKTLVDDAVASRGGILRLLVIGPEVGGESYLFVTSSENSNPDNRPKLVIDYSMPVPGAPMTGNMQELIGNLGG